VGHDDDRRSRPTPEAEQLDIEPLPGERIEGAERLVQEEDAGLERQGTGERGALPHAARELRGNPVLGTRRSPCADTRAVKAMSTPIYAATLVHLVTLIQLTRDGSSVDDVAQWLTVR